MMTSFFAQCRSMLAESSFATALAFTVSLLGMGSLTAQSIDDITLNVYKDVNCGCCVGWIDHMHDKGFASKINHPRNLNGVKHDLGVLPEWQSCHTAVNKEVKIPMRSVVANPLMGPDPNTYKIKAVNPVVMLASKIDDSALLNPSLTDSF